jgi:hypothetical protein
LAALVRAVVCRSLRSQSGSTPLDVAVRSAVKGVKECYRSHQSVTTATAIDIVVARIVRCLLAVRKDAAQ